MKRSKKRILVLVGLLVFSLALGGIAFANPFGGPGGYMGGYGHMSNMMGPGMMGGYGNYYGYDSNAEKMPVDKITAAVENYIKYFGDNLEIGDMFIYKNSDYYVSIEEKDTGKGAMELLVSPFTGAIYPEYGPNMMWNEKYGMHGRFGMMGMMGMGGWYFGSLNENINKIAREEAVEIADQYVKNYINKDLAVENEGHEFYGYYTFHVNKGDEVVGMLSVNYRGGYVWYHTWHGEIEQVISYHDEE